MKQKLTQFFYLSEMQREPVFYLKLPFIRDRRLIVSRRTIAAVVKAFILTGPREKKTIHLLVISVIVNLLRVWACLLYVPAPSAKPTV